jgi:hypothetical protein
MRNHYLFVIFLLHFFSVHSQSFFVKSGKNFTNYEYYNSEGVKAIGLGTDVGNYHEFGTAFSSKRFKRFTYELSIVLNEYNSIVIAPNPAMTYKTQYLGLSNTVLFSIIKSKYFVFDAKTGINMNTILYGKQEVEGVIKDIKESNNFKNLLLMSTLGVQAKVVLTSQVNLSLGFDYQYNFFDNTIFDKGVTVTNENLFFNNKQIRLGVYVLLDPFDKKLK